MHVPNPSQAAVKPTYVHSVVPQETNETWNDLSIMVSLILSVLGPVLHAYGICSQTAMLSTTIGGAISALTFLAIKLCKYCGKGLNTDPSSQVTPVTFKKEEAESLAPVVSMPRRGSAPAVLSPERPRAPAAPAKKLVEVVISGTKAEVESSFKELKKRMAAELLTYFPVGGASEMRDFLHSTAGTSTKKNPREIYPPFDLAKLATGMTRGNLQQLKDSFNTTLRGIAKEMGVHLNLRESTTKPSSDDRIVVSEIRAFFQNLPTV